MAGVLPALTLLKPVRLGDVMAPEANSFGVLRFAMASLVLVSHSFLYSTGMQAQEPLFGVFQRSLGQFAVQGFFILSGLLVAQSFDRSRSLTDFVAGRLLRIFPGLAVCVMACVLIVGPAMTTLPLASYFGDPATYVYVVKTLSLSTGAAPLPGVFESNAYGPYVNSSLWTLKYEVACYLLLGLMGLAGVLRSEDRRGWVALGLLVIMVVSSHTVSGIHEGRFVDHLTYFVLYFSAGVLAFVVRRDLPLHGFGVIALGGALAAVIGTGFQDFAAALFLGYGALWLATKPLGPMRGLCNRYDTSFGIYIYAGPVQQALLALVPGISIAMLTLSAFAIVFPIALLSWIAIEKPALGLRRALVRWLPGLPGLQRA